VWILQPFIPLRSAYCPSPNRHASLECARVLERMVGRCVRAMAVCFLMQCASRMAASDPSPTSQVSNQMEHQPGASFEGKSTSGDDVSEGGRLFIKEYRIVGSKSLPRIEIEAAVYPFLGPGRTRDDVELARSALEKAYQNAGFQTVGVEIPQQQVANGIVYLKVVERTVGRLRVKGAKYSSPKKIKTQAPSIAEGKVINFNEVPRDILALNQLPDRRVTPSLHPGVDPDTVDVDLEVKETSPLHASVELNNRYGPDTDPLRLNVTVSDNDLWQLGHGASLSYQTSPQDTSEVKVLSGYYLARFRDMDWLNLMFLGTKQDSDVSTLGDVAVAGRGETFGLRAILNLPPGIDFTDSASFGIDYKHFNQVINVASSGSVITPITYYPLSANYSATWFGKGSSTEFNSGVTFTLRGFGNNQAEFSNSRYNADGGFIYFHGDISHTHDLPLGFQIYGKVQGQVSDKPLVSSDEVAGGGLGTVRGYLEAEVVGDNAIFGSVELRSPSLLKLVGQKKGEWRVYGFFDDGIVTLEDPLPEQTSRFHLASYGAGTRFQVGDHFEGAVNLGIPLYDQAETKANDLRVTFRAALDY
jgi:hemolysin activation/secretion protein